MTGHVLGVYFLGHKEGTVMIRILQTLSICLLLAVLVSAADSIAPSAEETKRVEEPAAPLKGPILLALNPSYSNQAPEPAGDAEDAPEEQTDGAPATEPPDAAAPQPKRTLSPAMVALRDRVRRTLEAYRRQMLSTRDNTATELMHACLAFGCNTEVYQNGSSGKKANGITTLCWNVSCAGYEPLVISDGRVAARIGYGVQERPSQLLAVLALARVNSDYPMRVGEDVRNVADLVEHEKLGCRSNADLSLTLTGLAYYVDDDATWTNSLGEEWSVERIVQQELAGELRNVVAGETDRVMGLGYLLSRRATREQPIEGQFLRAKTFIDQYHDYVLKHQNSDGSWGIRRVSGGSTTYDSAQQLHATGRVLEWLAVSLPEDRLEDAGVVRAVAYLDNLLANGRYRHDLNSYSTQQIGSVMHALHALAVYDERVFEPSDPEPAETPADRQAARP